MGDEFGWIFNTDSAKEDGSGEKDKTEKASFMSVKELQRSKHKINRLKELSKNKLPKQGEHFMYFVDSQFDAISFLEFILENESKIDNLVLASYSYSRLTALSIKNYIENNIVEQCILASTTSLRSRYPQSYAILENIQGNIETKYTSLHAKLLLAKCGLNYYVLTGSGNFAKNARIEQYNFFNEESIYNFYLENIKNIESKETS